MRDGSGEKCLDWGGDQAYLSADLECI
jgi:hypothetical protein